MAPSYGQTGWAAVELVAGTTVKELWGPAPASLPVHRRIKRAEMWAFYELLQNAIPPIQAVIDHLAIVQGLQRGQGLVHISSASPRRPLAPHLGCVGGPRWFGGWQLGEALQGPS